MPLFFFHIRDAHQELSRDEMGLEFPDVETVYLMTLRAALDVEAELAACGLSPRDYVIEVVDAADRLVFKLPFSEALDQRFLH
jgi:hypothetical protein